MSRAFLPFAETIWGLSGRREGRRVINHRVKSGCTCISTRLLRLCVNALFQHEMPGSWIESQNQQKQRGGASVLQMK